MTSSLALLQRKKSQFLATELSGRHGVPSLRIVIFFAATALATKSFTTKSRRKRSLIPQAVAKRRQVIWNLESANGSRSRSAKTLLRAYAVKGSSADCSLRRSEERRVGKE